MERIREKKRDSEQLETNFYADPNLCRILLLKNRNTLNECYLNDLLDSNTFVADQPDVFKEIKLNLTENKSLKQASLDLGRSHHYLSSWRRSSQVNFLSCLLEIEKQADNLPEKTVEKVSGLSNSTRQQILEKNKQSVRLEHRHTSLFRSVQYWLVGFSLSESSRRVGFREDWLEGQLQTRPSLFWRTVAIVVTNSVGDEIDSDKKQALVKQKIDELKSRTIQDYSVEPDQLPECGQSTESHVETGNDCQARTGRYIAKAVEMVVIGQLSYQQASQKLGFDENWLSQQKRDNPDHLQSCLEQAEKKIERFKADDNPDLLMAVRLYTVECLNTNQIGVQLNQSRRWFVRKMIHESELVNDCFETILTIDGVDEETKQFLRESFQSGRIHCFRAIEAYINNYNMTKASQLFRPDRNLLSNFRSRQPDLFFRYVDQALKQQSVPQEIRLEIIKMEKRGHWPYYKAIEKYVSSNKAVSLEEVSLEMGYHSGWLATWKLKNYHAFDQYLQQILSKVSLDN